ncbi:hypothetical protein GCG54_00015182 [Colletotrichum gloeosporioides]|uniref:Nephrocystin 3-like N-terminal domain-containing protein n=1 Tax=Colletotrichum gloeosporioides TaxID=474922 RepID=A0A8H4CDP1_COLGL|nr:uncharacterized protein GCG54_00015182 [Colletotrichum gloeosporioides]KAF3801959.1 hypothetical protein GCG54_00015182 [Colletotrichum gloeosporioides]
MDPFSLTVGVIGILTAVQSCLKTINKNFGPSSMSSEEIQGMMNTLWELIGVMESLKTYHQLHGDDDDRMTSLKPVMTRSREAIQIIEDYISSGRWERFLHGVKFDRKLKIALRALDDTTKIFRMALVSDQHTIMQEVNNYLHMLGDDVRGVQAAQTNVQRDHAYSDVIDWLEAKSDNNLNSQIHERNLSLRDVGSGSWLVQQATFQNWLLSTNESESKSKIWLTGSPGAGKSTLCSTAIEYVSTTLRGVCFYYFHRFDDQYESGDRNRVKAATALFDQSESGHRSGVKAAAALVDQLFRYFYRKDERMATYVSNYVKTEEKNLASLAETARLIIKYAYGSDKEDGGLTAADQFAIHYFLDGVDEEKGADAAKTIIELLHGLDEAVPVVQKIWVSSRRTNILARCLTDYTVINLDEHGRSDVESFLIRRVPELDESWLRAETVEGKPIVTEWVLQEVQAKAKGNFLYARLIVDWLKDRVFTIDDVAVFIKSRVPDHFAEIYHRIFRQYYQEDQHKYVSLLFSLIAFARRPLRWHELREAMALALSDPTNGVNPRAVPNNLQRLFAPLIETQEDPTNPENPLCRLCHSTVQEFLAANPDVLRSGTLGRFPTTSLIAASRVGHIYLRYLSQAKYSTLVDLSRSDCLGTLTLSYDDAQQHGLLPYSAEYWDRHLEDLAPTPAICKELIEFLSSPNFQTLIQVQSLFVWGHFEQFRAEGSATTCRPLYRRAIPRWFGPDYASRDFAYLEDSRKIRRDYRHFANEWGHLLNLGNCETSKSGKCLTEHFWGEVDRCLTSLLGPTHFMARMKERYQSFMLTCVPFECGMCKRFIIADTVSPCGSQYIVMSSPSEKSPQVSLETWDLKSPHAPQCVSVTPVTPANIDFKSDNARPIAFSHTVAKFVSANRDGDARSILDQHKAHRNFEPLSTEFDMRDEIVVIASRNAHKRAHKAEPQGVNSPSVKVVDVENDSDSDFAWTESGSDSDDEYSSDFTDENSACETCSEGSTCFGSDDSDSEKSEIEAEHSLSESSKQDDEDEDECDLQSTDDKDEDEDNCVSDSTDDEERPEPAGAPGGRPIFRPQRLTESELELEDESHRKKEDDRPMYPDMPIRLIQPNDRIKASIEVYDCKPGQNVRMFRYEHETPATGMMYHSPPVLHPHKSLVVWPLGGGEILFADYAEKSYFIRAALPTTRDSK